MKSKPSTSITFPHARRALSASVVAVLIGAVPVLAQSGAAGSSSSGSSQKNPTGDARTSTTGTSTTDTSANEAGRNKASPAARGTGAGYQSATAGADADAATDINSRHAASGTRSGGDKLAWGDRRFVTKAAVSGMDEVNLSQLAAQRASNPEVRAFAQKLVTAHEQVNSELSQMAGRKNVKLDTDDDKDRTYNRLAKKSGAEFDQEFIEHMVDEHEKSVKMFEKASSDAKDADVRSFAAKHVTHLREHLQQAESLRHTVMPTGRVDDSSGRSTPATRSTTDSNTLDTRANSPTSTATPGTSSDRTTTPKRESSR